MLSGSCSAAQCLMVKYYCKFAVGVDYTFNPMDLTFPAGSQQGDQQCVTIAITDDVAVENSETFNVQLSTTDSRVEFSSICNRARVTITDSDGEYIKF